VDTALLSIAVLPALVLALLAVPVTVAFRVDRIEVVRGQLNFRWLFGLARFRVAIPAAVKPEGRRKRKPAKKAGERKTGSKARGVVALLRQSVFRRHVVRFIKGVFRAIHGRSLYLRLRIGLGDPADTGRLWAFLGPVAGIAADLRSAEVHIEPEFMDPVLEIESHGELRLVPLRFIALAVVFVVSPTTLRAWRTLRHGNA